MTFQPFQLLCNQGLAFRFKVVTFVFSSGYKGDEAIACFWTREDNEKDPILVRKRQDMVIEFL